MRGVCPDHTNCDNAIHIVGGAQHFVLRNSRILDFNAQIKVNGENGAYPDDGLLEFNTLSNGRPRDTNNSVVPVDMVAASNWHVAGNLITDFVKSQGNRVSYGAFAKGAGDHNVFERNAVLCEFRLRGYPGQRIGLSFGGGGTGAEFFRNQDTTHGEQSGSLMRDNLVAFCSDGGVYLNRAAQSDLEHNTLIDTAGIDARFAETTAALDANIVDGVIRGRDGATLREAGNLASSLLGLFVGWHPERRLFTDVGLMDLRWRDAPAPQPNTTPGDDLCGVRRTGVARPGAFEEFAPCLKLQPKP